MWGRRTLGKLVGIAALMTVLMAGNAEANPAYLTVSTSPSDLYPQPVLNPEPAFYYYGSAVYHIGNTITVTAQAVPCYTFQRWTENGIEVSASTSFAFVLDEDRDLVAEYSKNQYKISVNTDPYGLDPQPSGGDIYYCEDKATITAKPVQGHTFSHWQESVVSESQIPSKASYWISSDISYSFTVFKDANFEAVYSRNQYNISVLASPSDIPKPYGGGPYYYGDMATISAQSVAGYTFKQWAENGNPVSKEAAYEFQVKGNRNLTAEYSPNTYYVSISTLPSGLIPEPDGRGTYYYGDKATISAQSVTGYTFKQWVENGNPVSKEASYEFQVKENRKLTAEYSPNPYFISVSTLPSGLTPEPQGGGNYYYGDEAKITAYFVDNYRFERWAENGNPVSTSTSYSFYVSENKNLVAEYSRVATATITLEPGSGEPGREITVKGNGFNIYAEKSPHISIYFDGTLVKEGVDLYKDESGTVGSFSTNFMIPEDTESGTYRVEVIGPKNTPSEYFTVKRPLWDWKTIIEIFIVIAAVSGLRFMSARFMKWLSQPPSGTGKPFPVNTEIRGGIESIGTQLRDYAINMEVKGGIEL